MGTPQQPELRRSGTTPVDPDSDPSHLSRHRAPDAEGEPRRTPEENRPGHHPDHEQDRPPLDEVAERLGTKAPDAEDGTAAPSGWSAVAASRAKIGAALGLRVLADAMLGAARALRRLAAQIDDEATAHDGPETG